MNELIAVSVLYREPKLLKGVRYDTHTVRVCDVSVLYREPKLLKHFVKPQHTVVSFEFQCSTVSRNC